MIVFFFIVLFIIILMMFAGLNKAGKTINDSLQPGMVKVDGELARLEKVGKDFILVENGGNYVKIKKVK